MYLASSKPLKADEQAACFPGLRRHRLLLIPRALSQTWCSSVRFPPKQCQLFVFIIMIVISMGVIFPVVWGWLYILIISMRLINAHAPVFQ